MFSPYRVLEPLIVLVPLQREELTGRPHAVSVREPEDYCSVVGLPNVTPVNSAPVAYAEAREFVDVRFRNMFRILVHAEKH